MEALDQAVVGQHDINVARLAQYCVDLPDRCLGWAALPKSNSLAYALCCHLDRAHHAKCGYTRTAAFGNVAKPSALAFRSERSDRNNKLARRQGGGYCGTHCRIRMYDCIFGKVPGWCPPCGTKFIGERLRCEADRSPPIHHMMRECRLSCTRNTANNDEMPCFHHRFFPINPSIQSIYKDLVIATSAAVGVGGYWNRFQRQKQREPSDDRRNHACEGHCDRGVY